jgi:Suppressor of fused protein (SUFU)
MFPIDPFQLSDPDLYANAIAEHVVAHIGPITNVFHEIKPDVVAIDLLVVGPRDGWPFTTLVTCGMSDLPMRIPIEDPDDLGRVPELRFAELLLCLPADWPLTPDAFRNEEHYWPVRWLKRLARLPHRSDGWLGVGHTIPNGDPPKAFTPNVAYCGWLIDQPVLFPEPMQKLRVHEKAINFYSMVPLYEEEMTLKLRKGRSAIAHLFDRTNVSELIDLNRRNVGQL